MHYNYAYHELAGLATTDSVPSQRQTVRRDGQGQTHNDEDNGQDNQGTARISDDPTSKTIQLVSHFYAP
jgi:hypothetical protein